MTDFENDLVEELACLRDHVRELQYLIISLITDDKVAQLDDHHLLELAIADRTGTHAFDLRRIHLEGWRVLPTKMPLDRALVAYVERLARLGMRIEVDITGSST